MFNSISKLSNKFKYFKSRRFKIKYIYDINNDRRVFCIKGPLGVYFIRINKAILLSVTSFNLLIFSSIKFCLGFLASLQTLIYGLYKGFFATLKTEGVGYKFIKIKGLKKVLSYYLGFGHILFYKFPFNFVFRSLKFRLVLFSTSHILLAYMALQIRGYRSPDPYKSKGVKFLKEALKLKPGKQRQR